MAAALTRWQQRGSRGDATSGPVRLFTAASPGHTCSCTDPVCGARCLRTLAVAAEQLGVLQSSCVASMGAAASSLEAAENECELSARGALALAAVLCDDGGAWHGGTEFGLTLLPVLLRLLRADYASTAASTLHRMSDQDNEARAENDDGDDDDAAGGGGGSSKLSATAQLGLEQLLPGLFSSAPGEEQHMALSVVLWTAIKTFLSESGEGQLEGRSLALTLGSRFDSFLFGAIPGTVDVREDVSGFWEPLRLSLGDTRKVVRHQGLLLLQHAIGSPSREAHSEEADWARIQRAWKVYIMLFETLEQPEYHLLPGLWPEVQVFCSELTVLRGGPSRVRVQLIGHARNNM